jgi:energy-coupling factor transport system permease protein
MNLLMPGMYIAADSPLHRLDPRTKVGTTLLLMVVPFAAPGIGSTVLLIAFVAVLALISSVPMVSLLRTLTTVVWVGLFMFVFYFFTTPGRALLELGPLTLTWEGLLAGARQIYRLCLLVIVSSLLTFTTSPAQLSHALEAVLGPLAPLGLPVRELAMVMTISLRFVPTLSAEIEGIIKAQEARGAHIRSGNLWQRMQGWVPVFVPIFVSAFRRAEELATAMDARGFRSAHARTRLHRLEFSWRDLAATAIALGVVVLAMGLDRFL